MYSAKMAERRKRLAAKKAGLCPQCGKRKLYRDKKQCKHCLNYAAEWRTKHRDRSNEMRRHEVRRMRSEVLRVLGGRCASKICRYRNLDGTFGCTDLRILHVDHKKGNGNKDRLKLWARQIWKKVLKNPKNYQLLCPTCNWIKRIEEKEYFRANSNDPITEITYGTNNARIHPNAENRTAE